VHTVTVTSSSIIFRHLGTSVCVYLRGRLVLHVLAGVFRYSSELSAAGCWRPVDEHTLFMSYSVAKGVTAMALLSLVDRGLVTYQDRVVDWWPEFGIAGGRGKLEMTVGDAVSHRGGLGSLLPFSLGVLLGCLRGHWAGDWRVAWAAGEQFVESMCPEFEVGMYARYHYVSFSWIMGGILQRVVEKEKEQHEKGGAEGDGRLKSSVSEIVKDTVGCAIGCRDDMFIGLLPPDQLSRVALLEPLRPWLYAIPNSMSELRTAKDSLEILISPALQVLPPLLRQALAALSYLLLAVLAMLEAIIFCGIGNCQIWRGMCLPSSNGYFTSQAVAALYGALANGGEVEVAGGIERAEGTSPPPTVLLQVFSKESVARLFEEASDRSRSVPMYDIHTDRESWGRHSKGFSPWPLPTLHGSEHKLGTLGHQGMGGCSSFGCQETGLAVCILRNVYDPLIISEGAVKLDDGLLSQIIRDELTGHRGNEISKKE
jgi:hypothetical protein